MATMYKMPGWIRWSGLIVAILGFLITRVFVAETVHLDGTLLITLISLIPLVVGLGHARPICCKRFFTKFNQLTQYEQEFRSADRRNSYVNLNAFGTGSDV